MEDPEAPLICLTNGGGIRADLPAGTITFGDVTAVLPFGNTIEVLAIDGATLKAALEFAYDSVRHASSPSAKRTRMCAAHAVVRAIADARRAYAPTSSSWLYSVCLWHPVYAH